MVKRKFIFILWVFGVLLPIQGLTLRLDPSPALQNRDKGALRVNPEQAPAFRSERAEGWTIPESGKDQADTKLEEKGVLEWRKERDIFFKTHQRSPLLLKEKRDFKGLKYYPFDPKYVFSGPIERYIFHINNPKYYATFLTNKGTNKRYLRYGKFRFNLNGKEYAIEIYKSILSDNTFIPFKDKTNGKESYEGGRYIDAEILPGYKMVLDFNMAYYPSCAYNDHFICVLPPKENMLDIEIRAGEKNFK